MPEKPDDFKRFKAGGALRLPHPVGRKTEERIIRQAINDDGDSHILHLVGSGGIGKTMLLEEVKRWCPRSVVCPDIIDLYTENTNSRVESAIVSALGKKHFQRYRDGRKRFEGRLVNWDPEQLTRERQKLTSIFVKDLNAYAKTKRVILRFDTVETIQYERAEIEQAYGIQPPDVELKTWLLRVIPKLRNTVTILAGREHPELSESLKEALGKRLELIELKELDEEGTLEYLREMEREAGKRLDMQGVAKVLSQFPEPQRRVIHIYTNGHPILLALFIDWLIQEQDVPDAFKTESEQALRQTEEEIEAICERVRQELVLRLTGNLKAPVPAALQYLGWARKGMDGTLFARIHGREWKELGSFGTLEDSLGRLSFVKIRPRGIRRIFLHDEMYDLFDQYGFLRLELREQICDEIIRYYEEQIEREQDQDRVNDLRVEQLYYELVRNPQAGLLKFFEWDEQAIREGWSGYDMRLRDEVARFRRKEERRLRDLGIDPLWIDQDAALRWIRRFYMAKNYPRALEFIAGLKRRGLFDPASPMLALYEGIVKGQASIDLADTAAVLRKNLNLLKPSDNVFQQKQVELACAEAYNALGYTLRGLKQYQGAIDSYQQAIEYQKRLGLKGLRAAEADTLNNLAYVSALQGDPNWALGPCEDARKIREEELKHKYTTALSYNTLGLIHMFDRDPELALEPCKKALRLAQEAKSLRVEGMARNALGMVYRNLAHREQTPYKQAVRHFAQAEKMLQAAIKLWEHQAQSGKGEIPREVEAYNELGCTYRDWAIQLKAQGKTKLAEDYLNRAERYLQSSIERAKSEQLIVEQADGLEDLAEIYGLRGESARAFEVLDEAEVLIPSEYQLGDPGIETIADPVNGYWLALGKINLQRGDLYFESDLSQAMKHYVLADAYFRRYSQLGNLVETTSRRVRKKIWQLTPSERVKAYGFARSAAEQLGLTNLRLIDALRIVPGGQT